ncbi:MAG: hypothetical protein EZS28_050429, partial [Streblomastix strix]
SNSGGVKHVGDIIYGNQPFKPNDRVGIEIDLSSNPRTATLFINDVEQPLYVINIPLRDGYRFYSHIIHENQSFTLAKLESRTIALRKGTANSKALDWGQKWVGEKQDQKVETEAKDDKEKKKCEIQ